MKKTLPWLCAGLLLAGCTTEQARHDRADCEGVPGIDVICGLQAPEDIEVLADDRYLLLSQFGGLQEGPGDLVLFDRATRESTVLYPLAGALAGGAGPWGDEHCPGEPGQALSPHGIHLSRRADGAWQLLVVNHGGRESVEFFELTNEAGRYTLSWRGCAVAPDDAFLNDVAALPDGGFLVTHMFDKSLAQDPEAVADAATGKLNGHVWEWQADSGFRIMPGSEMPMPNGIQVDASGERVYLNAYGAGAVLKLDRHSGEILARAEVPGPDNSSWGLDGRLLVASHTGEITDFDACSNVGAGFCPLAYQIVALDPNNLDIELLFEHDGQSLMGAGTVAVQVGEALYIGSFAGDRMLRVSLPRP